MVLRVRHAPRSWSESGSLSVGQVVGLVVVGLAVLVGVAGGPEGLRALTAGEEGCPGATRVPGSDNVEEVRAATLCLLNRERTDRGLSPLSVDSRLTAAAQQHSEDMGARDFYAHATPDGREASDRIFAAGLPREGSTTGENIHWGVNERAMPSRIVRDWMDSPGHRANILGPAFTHIGIGVGLDPPKFVSGRAAMYTTNFAGYAGNRQTP